MGWEQRHGDKWYLYRNRSVNGKPRNGQEVITRRYQEIESRPTTPFASSGGVRFEQFS